MARTRSIKPGFFSNEYLAELPFEARLLFAGLWTLADRRGRLEDRPKGIKGRLFPFDNVDIDPLLQQLEDSPERFIIRYEAEGRRYIQITNFEKHQHINVKEQESTIPAPDKHGASMVQAPDNNETGTIPAPDEHALLPSTSYPLPHTSNLLPSTSAPKPPSGGASAYSPEFERFWSAYPRKLDKGNAYKKYKARLKDGYTPEQLEAAARSYAQECRQQKTEERFIKHPKTFLSDALPFADFIPKTTEPETFSPDQNPFEEWREQGGENTARTPDDENPFAEWAQT